MTALARVHQIYEALQVGLVERDEPLRLALLAALSGEHFLLIGPPGTAKSMLARRLHLAIRGRYFERLLTRFTVPEEIFGPLSIRGLENDLYERLVDGYLPTATIAFLDEIFKANSAILNALLGVLNERVMDQGARRDSVPLICLVGASNELPESEELAALSDRFILRYEVGPVSKDAFETLLRTEDSTSIPDGLALDADDLREIRQRAEAILVPRWLIAIVADVREKLVQKGIYVSDRRWRKSVDVLKTAALIDDRDTVGLVDLELLRHLLWQRPDQRSAIDATLRNVFVDTFLSEPERFETLVDALEKTLGQDTATTVQLQDREGPLYVADDGSDTHAAVRRGQRMNSSGQPLYRPPRDSSRYACTVDQLRERFSEEELERYVADPLNWLLDHASREPRVGQKRWSRAHVNARVAQVSRVRAHLGAFAAGVEDIASSPSSEGTLRELAAVREQLERLRLRLEILEKTFAALPTHEEGVE